MSDIKKLKEEFENVIMYFHSFNKYSFEYHGKSKFNKNIEIIIGGDSDDIYRLYVSSEMILKDLLDEQITINVQINDKWSNEYDFYE